MKIPVLNDVLPLYLGVFHSKLNVEGILERFQVASSKLGELIAAPELYIHPRITLRFLFTRHL